MSTEIKQRQSANPVSATTNQATYLQINARNNGEFCTILLPSPPTFGSGRLLIDSTFGVYGYCWTHIGATKSFPDFLASLDMEYMGIKMLGSDAHEYDYRQTKNEIRHHIKQLRRQRKLTKDEAEEEWCLSEDVECESTYHDWLVDSKIPDVCELEYGDLLVQVMNHQWQAFWNKLWVPLVVPELRKIAQECAARLEFERQGAEEARRESERLAIISQLDGSEWDECDE